MHRYKALGTIVMMVAASLCLPFGVVLAEGGNPAGLLQVTDEYNVNGNESWRGVSLTSTGVLTVGKGATLTAQYIKLKGGALKVDGGTIVIQNASDGQDAYIGDIYKPGVVTTLELINGAKLVLQAPDGNNLIDTCQGGDARVDITVTDSFIVKGASIDCYAGNGYNNPEPWVDHQKLVGYYAAGGNGSVRIVGSNDSAVANPTKGSVEGLAIKLVGGNGAKAADGKSPINNYGGKGGGYSNGGEVGGFVGAGGQGIVNIGAFELSVRGLTVTATGGRGGRGGNGGGLEQDVTQTWGSGGGGGYSGGNGGDYSGTGNGEDGGAVSGYVGSGGLIDIDLSARNLTVYGADLTLNSGRGGDGGTGGYGNYRGGGGGAGYGGGGGPRLGSSSYKAGKGNVTGRVGAGGNISVTFLGDDSLFASNISATTLAGQGGTGGMGGPGGSTTGATYGGGGGGGYGGGGGAGYSSGEPAGSTTVSGEVGMGGNVTFTYAGGVGPNGGELLVANSTLILFGGAGGQGGAGGRGGYSAGGGGGGYGGGGGSYSVSGGPGAGAVNDYVGHGGGSTVVMTSYSNPGQLVARNNKIYLVGGNGGDGGPGGLAGSPYGGGGGGGYAGGGGRYQSGTTGPSPSPGKMVGSGGNSEIDVIHVAPSVSKHNSISLIPGKAGNGRNQPGGGTGGGNGLGAKTSPGDQVPNIPMGVVYIISPKPNEVVNSIPPTFEWEPLIYSGSDGDVISYTLQVDDLEDFSAPDIDTGMELQTSLTPTSELAAGGVYYWRVMATYMTGNSYGYGPVHKFSFNTPPVLKKNIPLTTFKEDITATRWVNLSFYFTDDLFADQLDYKIIYETDPSHILATVDGNYITFTTPTKDWNGWERFAVRAVDPLGLGTNSNTFNVRVTPVNDAPTLLPVPDITVTEGEEHFFDMTPYVTDIDSRVSDIIITTNSSYCRVAGLGLYLTYPAGMGITGDKLGINVSDGFDYALGTLNIVVQKANTPPTISAPSPWVLYMTEDTDFSLLLQDFASDLETNNSELSWNVTGISAGNPPMFSASILSRNTLRITPATDQNGVGTLVLVVIDKGGKEDSRTVTVIIEKVNDAPTVSHLPDTKLVAGASKVIDLTKYISDVDNPITDLKVLAASPLANVEGLKLTLFVKSDASESQDLIPISVSDGTDTSISEFLLKIVFPPSIPQVIQTIKTADDKVKEIDLKEYVFDKDSPEASLNWQFSGGNPKYFTVSIDPNTHIMKITPKAKGNAEITLTVTDPDGGTASQSVQVKITHEEKPVVIPTGVYVLVAFVVVAAVVGISLFAMRRK